MLNLSICMICWRKYYLFANESHMPAKWKEGVSFLCPKGNGDSEYPAYTGSVKHLGKPSAQESAWPGYWYSLHERPPSGCPYFLEHTVSSTDIT
jgi:hypothetical protein